uniref:Uncharacterized protein n=1 Tax=Arundo donax TaxID=35708 RepID=A0A0A8Y0E2_ARUDO
MQKPGMKQARSQDLYREQQLSRLFSVLSMAEFHSCNRKMSKRSNNHFIVQHCFGSYFIYVIFFYFVEMFPCSLP